MLEILQRSFQQFIDEYLVYHERELHRTVRIKDATGEIDAEQFIKNYNVSPSDYQKIINAAHLVGTAYEFIGQKQMAINSYFIGTFKWRFEWPIHPSQNGAQKLSSREAIARDQIISGVCNERIGEKKRASLLFTWASEHLEMKTDEIRYHGSSKQENVIWENFSEKAFAQICLEHWLDAIKTIEDAIYWVKMDKGRFAIFGRDYQPFVLLPIMKKLAEYGRSPTEKGRIAVEKSLSVDDFKIKENVPRLNGLFYLFALRAKFAGLSRE